MLLLLLLLLQHRRCWMHLHLLLALMQLTVLYSGRHQLEVLCLPPLHRGSNPYGLLTSL